MKNVRVASEMTVSHDAFFEQHPADGEIQKYEYNKHLGNYFFITILFKPWLKKKGER